MMSEIVSVILGALAFGFVLVIAATLGVLLYRFHRALKRIRPEFDYGGKDSDSKKRTLIIKNGQKQKLILEMGGAKRGKTSIPGSESVMDKKHDHENPDGDRLPDSRPVTQVQNWDSPGVIPE